MRGELRSGRWTIDPVLGTVKADGGESKRIGPTLMAALVVLTGRPGLLVSKDELIEEAWEGRAVSDDAVTVAIYELRKLFGDKARRPRFIQTIPSRGYRWLPAVGPVDHGDADETSGQEPVESVQVGRRWLRLRTLGAVAALALAATAITFGLLSDEERHESSVADPGEGQLTDRASPLPGAALDSYLEGRASLQAGSADRLDSAIESFRRAIELAPNLAEAWAGLSEAYSTRVERRIGEPLDELERARSTGLRALELNRDSPEALHALGLAAMLADWDLGKGEALFRHAVALDPSYGRGWRSLAWVLLARKRWDEAEAAAHRAMLVDPHSPEPLYPLATLLLATGRAPEALASLERAVDLAEDDRRALGTKLVVLMEFGHREEAVAAYREMLGAYGYDLEAFDRLVAEGGLDAVFRDTVVSERPSVTHFWRAVQSAWLGDAENAIRELELSANAGECEMLVARVYPAFQALDGDPRYSAVLARVGLGG